MKKFIGTKIIHAEPQVKDGVDGYKVVYSDNYISWSPKNVFEEAYREIDNMSFGLALEALRKGFKVARKGWNGKGIYIEMQNPDEHSKMTQPYLYIVTTNLITNNQYAPKGIVPWLPSQTDILAEDWLIVEYEKLIFHIK